MIAASPNRRSYWLRLGRLFVGTLLLALIVTPLMLGALATFGLTHPPCGHGVLPAGISMVTEAIQFTSSNGLQVSGYYAPGSNGATVVMIPAYNSAADTDLATMALLNGSGFTVLSFDSRVCGALGWISLGYYEVEDVLAAFDFLNQRGVDMGRVGLYGFSSAGATAMMTAAHSPIPRSLIAQGGYHNYPAAAGMDDPFHPFVSLFQFGSGLAYRLLTGTSIRNLDPIGEMDGLQGKTILLMYGSVEPSLAGARLMLARGQALGLDMDLWVVEGADHGTYALAAPDEFPRRVVTFYQETLLQ